MTVSSTQVRTSYTGNGASVNFATSFAFYASTDLLVVLNGVTQTLAANYTVTGGNGALGTVVMNVAPANGINLQVILNPPLTQTVALVDGTAFPAATLNQEADRAVQIALRLNDKISRSLQVADGTDVNPNLTLPNIAARAGKFLTFGVSGEPLTSSGTGNDSALRTDLANATAGVDGSRLVGYRCTEASSLARSVFAVLSNSLLLADFVSDFTGASDQTSGINAAIAAGIASGRSVCHTGGSVRHDSKITLPNGLTMFGTDRKNCEFSYTGAGSGWQNVNGPNSSGYGLVNLYGLKLTSTNAANTGAAIELNAGGFSYYNILDCWLLGKWKYGLILDGVEICAFERNLIDLNGTPTAGVWIVNGADRVAAQTPGFTNVVTIRDNQISSSGVGTGIIDDGGNNHTITGNNFNNQSLPMRVAGCNSLVLLGNSFETHAATAANNVLFSNVTNAGNVVGACSNVVLQGCTFSGDMTAAGTQLKFGCTTFTVSAITRANPCVVTITTVSSTNPFAFLASGSDSPITLSGVVGMTQINNVSSLVTATGGVSGAWTLTLGTLDSSAFTAYVSGGTVANFHTGVTATNNYFVSVAGRGNAVDVTYLANSLVGYNADFNVSSGAGHYTGVHADVLGNTLLAPQNGAFGAGQPTIEYYGDSRFRKAFSAALQYNWAVITYSASMSFDLGTANHFDITATNNTAFTINSPSNANQGNRYSLTIRNTSGAGLGAITLGASFKTAGAIASPATGNQRTYDFLVDSGGVSHEMSRTAADVPN